MMSLIPVTFVGYLSLSIHSHFSVNEKIEASIANLRLISSMLDDEMKHIHIESIRISQDESVLALLGNQESNKSPDTVFAVKSSLYKFNNYPEIHSVYLFSLSNDVYTNRAASLLNLSDIGRLDWFKNGSQNTSNYFIGEPIFINKDIIIPYVRKIKDNNINDPYVGVSMINIYESTFSKIFSSCGDIVLLNDNNVILSSNQKLNIGKNFFDAYKTNFSHFPQGESIKTLLDKKPYLLSYYVNETGNYRLVEITPYDANTFPMSDILKSTILIIFICFILCIILAIILSGYVTYPLRKLKEEVDAFRIENLGAGIAQNSTDEIGMLESSFNNMAQRLKKSMEHIASIQEERYKAEYRAIELQINPHFLYNTLSAINWLANDGDTERVELVTNSLSRLFRISVSKGKELIRIYDEIEHVRCYLEIQKIRYKNEFNYQIDVDPNVLEYYTIKIILQPLAENSLYHGIRERGIENGLILINAKQEGNKIIFEVLDNGNITEDEIMEMNKILSTPDPSFEHGIGMLNVHTRIRHYYKKNYGLKYEKRGQYTVARIEIPISGADYPSSSSSSFGFQQYESNDG